MTFKKHVFPAERKCLVCGKPATMSNDQYELDFCSGKCFAKSLQDLIKDFVEAE